MGDHVKVHIGDKKHQCPYCLFRGVTRTAIKSHIMYRHANVPKMECPFCNYSTKLKGQLNYHLRHKHKNLFSDFKLEVVKTSICDDEILS